MAQWIYQPCPNGKQLHLGAVRKPTSKKGAVLLKKLPPKLAAHLKPTKPAGYRRTKVKFPKTMRFDANCRNNKMAVAMAVELYWGFEADYCIDRGVDYDWYENIKMESALKSNPGKCPVTTGMTVNGIQIKDIKSGTTFYVTCWALVDFTNIGGKPMGIEWIIAVDGKTAKPRGRATIR